jgi:hypothetical protein
MHEAVGKPSNGCRDTDGTVLCSPIKQTSLIKSLERNPRNIQKLILYIAPYYTALSFLPFFLSLYHK